jgi:predicted transport protein
MTNIQVPGAFTNELLEGLHSIIMEKYPKANKVERKTYIAYKDKTNIACLVKGSNCIKVYVKKKYSEIENPPGFVRSVEGIGHHGTGDTEITLKSIDELLEINVLI